MMNTTDNAVPAALRKDTDRPAFPSRQPRAGEVVTHGMTLRDYFAGQALEECIRLAQDSDGGWSDVNAAVSAYQVADAMLEAREKP